MKVSEQGDLKGILNGNLAGGTDAILDVIFKRNLQGYSKGNLKCNLKGNFKGNFEEGGTRGLKVIWKGYLKRRGERPGGTNGTDIFPATFKLE